MSADATNSGVCAARRHARCLAGRGARVKSGEVRHSWDRRHRGTPCSLARGLPSVAAPRRSLARPAPIRRCHRRAWRGGESGGWREAGCFGWSPMARSHKMDYGTLRHQSDLSGLGLTADVLAASGATRRAWWRGQQPQSSSVIPSCAGTTPGGSERDRTPWSRSVCRFVSTARRGFKFSIQPSASDSEKWLGCGV